MAIAVTPVTFGTGGQDEDVPHAAPVQRGAQISPGIPLVETQPASTEFGAPDDGEGKPRGKQSRSGHNSAMYVPIDVW